MWRRWTWGSILAGVGHAVGRPCRAFGRDGSLAWVVQMVWIRLQRLVGSVCIALRLLLDRA